MEFSPNVLKLKITILNNLRRLNFDDVHLTLLCWMRCDCHKRGVLEILFSNSLIIHKEKTKKITPLTVVRISADTNYQKILLTLSLNFFKNYCSFNKLYQKLHLDSVSSDTQTRFYCSLGVYSRPLPSEEKVAPWQPNLTRLSLILVLMWWTKRS